MFVCFSNPIIAMFICFSKLIIGLFVEVCARVSNWWGSCEWLRGSCGNRRAGVGVGWVLVSMGQVCRGLVKARRTAKISDPGSQNLSNSPTHQHQVVLFYKDFYYFS